VIVDDRWYRRPIFRQDLAHVISHGPRDVETLPSEPLGPPSQVCIFAIGEEGFIKELAAQGNVPYHGSPVERRRAAGAEYVFRRFVLADVRLVRSAVEVPLVGCEVYARRIENGWVVMDRSCTLFQRDKTPRGNAAQLARDRSDRQIGLKSFQRFFDE